MLSQDACDSIRVLTLPPLAVSRFKRAISQEVLCILRSYRRRIRLPILFLFSVSPVADRLHHEVAMFLSTLPNGGTEAVALHLNGAYFSVPASNLVAHRRFCNDFLT